MAVDGGKEEEGEKLPLDELAPAPTKNELIGKLLLINTFNQSVYAAAIVCENATFRIVT